MDAKIAKTELREIEAANEALDKARRDREAAREAKHLHSLGTKSGSTGTLPTADQKRIAEIKKRTLRAAHCVEDALNGRATFTLKKDWQHRIHDFHTRKWVLRVVFLCILGHMTLAFFETPSAHSPSVGETQEYILASFDIFFSLILFADVLLRILYRGVPYFKRGWNWVLFLSSLCFLVDVVMWFSGLRIVRFSRPLRACFCLARWRKTRGTVRAIRMSLPLLLPIVGLLLLFIIVFSVMGVVLFSDVYTSRDETEQQWENFDSLPNAMLLLWTLLTFENYPGCMKDAFTHSRASAVFFAGFLIVAAILFLNITVGVLYSAYKRQRHSAVLYDRLKERMSLLHAFAALDIERKQCLTWDRWLGLIRSLLPHSDVQEIRNLFEVVVEDANRTDNTIGVLQFFEMCDVLFLRHRFRKPKWRRHLASCDCYRVNPAVRRVFQHPARQYIFGVLLLVNFGVFCAFKTNMSEEGLGRFALALGICSVVLLLELLLRLVGLGMKFWNDNWHLMDLAVLLPSCLLGVVAWLAPMDRGTDGWRAIVALSALRLVCFVSVFEISKRKVLVLARIIPVAYSIFVTLLCVCYFYAIVGMELFAEVTVSQSNEGAFGFDNFLAALLTELQLFIGQNWPDAMYLGVDGVSPAAAFTYHVSFSVVVAIFFYNLLVAAVVEMFILLTEMTDREFAMSEADVLEEEEEEKAQEQSPIKPRRRGSIDLYEGNTVWHDDVVLENLAPHLDNMTDHKLAKKAELAKSLPTLFSAHTGIHHTAFGPPGWGVAPPQLVVGPYQPPGTAASHPLTPQSPHSLQGPGGFPDHHHHHRHHHAGNARHRIASLLQRLEHRRHCSVTTYTDAHLEHGLMSMALGATRLTNFGAIGPFQGTPPQSGHPSPTTANDVSFPPTVPSGEAPRLQQRSGPDLPPLTTIRDVAKESDGAGVAAQSSKPQTSARGSTQEGRGPKVGDAVPPQFAVVRQQRQENAAVPANGTRRAHGPGTGRRRVRGTRGSARNPSRILTVRDATRATARVRRVRRSGAGADVPAGASASGESDDLRCSSASSEPPPPNYPPPGHESAVAEVPVVTVNATATPPAAHASPAREAEHNTTRLDVSVERGRRRLAPRPGGRELSVSPAGAGALSSASTVSIPTPSLVITPMADETSDEARRLFAAQQHTIDDLMARTERDKTVMTELRQRVERLETSLSASTNSLPLAPTPSRLPPAPPASSPAKPDSPSLRVPARVVWTPPRLSGTTSPAAAISPLSELNLSVPDVRLAMGARGGAGEEEDSSWTETWTETTALDPCLSSSEVDERTSAPAPRDHARVGVRTRGPVEGVAASETGQTPARRAPGRPGFTGGTAFAPAPDLSDASLATHYDIGDASFSRLRSADAPAAVFDNSSRSGASLPLIDARSEPRRVPPPQRPLPPRRVAVDDAPAVSGPGRPLPNPAPHALAKGAGDLRW